MKLSCSELLAGKSPPKEALSSPKRPAKGWWPMGDELLREGGYPIKPIGNGEDSPRGNCEARAVASDVVRVRGERDGITDAGGRVEEELLGAREEPEALARAVVWGVSIPEPDWSGWGRQDRCQQVDIAMRMGGGMEGWAPTSQLSDEIGMRSVMRNVLVGPEPAVPEAGGGL